MRKNTILISERDLMFCISGQLYAQAPNRQPRKAEIIMKAVLDRIRVDFYNDNEFRTLRIEPDKLYSYIDNLLKSIPEFVELNLSQIEYENGVKVDDENRHKYSFVTRYDKYDSESWKSDFVDLDAFTRNVYNALLKLIDSNEDCFLCIHERSEKCSSCMVNPLLENHYESCRQPKGKYTFSCKFDCFRNRYICCEECEDKDTCEQKCDSNSDECWQALYKKN
jgi:hypothetical protein